MILFLHTALFVVLSSFRPTSDMSLLHASFHRRFGRPLLLFPGMFTSNILLTITDKRFNIVSIPYSLKEKLLRAQNGVIKVEFIRSFFLHVQCHLSTLHFFLINHILLLNYICTVNNALRLWLVHPDKKTIPATL